MKITGQNFAHRFTRLATASLKVLHNRWLWRIILWTLFAIVVRFAYFGEFYAAKSAGLNVLSASLIFQTMVLYYLYSIYIFPKTLYQRKIILFLICLFTTHVIVYEINYLTFWCLDQISGGIRAARDLSLFHKAGLSGFATSSTATFYSVFWTFPFAFMILTVKAVKDFLKIRTENLELEKDNLALELSFLKSQVNPHFLFNTLNSVYSRIFATDEQAANLVLQLSELMRYNLYETNETYVALDKELNFLQNYLDLERNRLEGQDVAIDYVESGNTAQYQIAPLILVAFVENAFKHGVKSALQPACVQVMAAIEEEQLLFQVENSVPPKRESAPSLVKSGGVGLGNVRQRLNALYKDRHTLDVTETDETYTVLLTIGLQPKAN